MTPKKYDFKPQYKGNTFRGAELTFSNEVNGVATPIDLTGATIEMVFKTSINSAAVKTLTINNGLKVVDAAGGVIQIDEFMVDLPASKYLYDIKISFNSGTVSTYVTGTFEVVQNLG